MTRGTLRRWLGLTLGLALMVVAVAGLHHASSSAGEVMVQSRARGLESDAYFYTEVSDVGAFLDDEGRYGRRSIRDKSTIVSKRRRPDLRSSRRAQTGSRREARRAGP